MAAELSSCTGARLDICCTELAKKMAETRRKIDEAQRKLAEYGDRLADLTRRHDRLTCRELSPRRLTMGDATRRKKQRHSNRKL